MAIEAMDPIEIVDLSTENGDFPVRYVNVYQRVSIYYRKTDLWFMVLPPAPKTETETVFGVV